MYIFSIRYPAEQAIEKLYKILPRQSYNSLINMLKDRGDTKAVAKVVNKLQEELEVTVR